MNYAKFGLYGSYFTPRFFIDGVFSGGVNWTAAQRQITILSDDTVYFPSLFRTASSNQTGHDFAVPLARRRQLYPRELVPDPYGRNWPISLLQQHAFDEQGAGGLNLSVQANQAQTLRSALGARLARTFTTASGAKITPEASIGWAHYFALDNRVINASLLELGGSFATNGFNGDTDSVLVGAGVTAQLTNGVAFSGRYNAEIGRGFTSHMLNLGVRCEF